MSLLHWFIRQTVPVKSTSVRNLKYLALPNHSKLKEQVQNINDGHVIQTNITSRVIYHHFDNTCHGRFIYKTGSTLLQAYLFQSQKGNRPTSAYNLYILTYSPRYATAKPVLVEHQKQTKFKQIDRTIRTIILVFVSSKQQSLITQY